MWKKRRVIVAGGTAGFGLVLAGHVARAGASVLVVGRSPEGVRAAMETIEASGVPAEQVHGLAADLSQSGEGNRVVAEAARRLGGVDDLFFCVGRSGRALILNTGVDELRAWLDANLLSAVEITRAFADLHFRASETKDSRIVYVGSLSGKLVTPFMGPYCVAKSALAAYADAVRLELSPRGAHVLLVSPGPIRRASSAPRSADAAQPRYAQEVDRDGLPAQANAPGGGTKLRPLDPDRLAERVLAACQRRHSELVVPRSAGLLAGLIEWFPDWGRQLLACTAGATRHATRQSSPEPVYVDRPRNQSQSARIPPQE
ncbi:MAG: SDR family NAD(P)-dependent oxidoreductase [Planctomycetota bacterium]